MKKLLFTSLLGLFALTSMAQEIGGCTSYFADNYSPVATFNNSTCNYDLQQLLIEGTSIADLLFSGVLEEELVGLFAAGGLIVHIDAEKGRALIGSAHSTRLHYESHYSTAQNETLLGSMLAEELVAYQFGSDLYDGELNWSILKQSYAANVIGRWTNDVTVSYSYPYADPVMSSVFSNMGYDDWFVPNAAELSLYWDIALGISYGTSVSWPLEPNGLSTYSLVAPFSEWNYSSNNRCHTSEVTNAGEPSDFVNNELVYVKTLIRQYGSSDGYDEIRGNSESALSGGGDGFVQPMRIERFDAIGTSTSCKSWEYDGVTNQAIDAGVTCSYPLFQCDSISSNIWDELVIGVYPATTSAVEYGRADTRDILMNVPATHEINNNTYDVLQFEITAIENVPPGLDLNLTPGDIVGGSEVYCLEFSEYAIAEGVYDLTISGTLFMDVLGSTLTTDITLTHRIAVTENVNGVQGCIYPTADNYNPLVTEDDGTCLFGGTCPGDFDGDGLIGIMDILHLLGIYDTSCE